MGCISSKDMMHSGSYHRDGMKGRSRRTSRGVPELPEDMLNPRNGSNHNHFLALVCTATSMTDTFRPKSFRFESLVSAAESEANETILKPDLVDDNDRRIREQEALPDPPKRSRSWHSFPLEETPTSDKESSSVNVDTSEVNGKGAIRSRSFHTVEEYDKLLARIWFVNAAEKGYTEADPVERETLTAPTGVNCRAESNGLNSQESLQPILGDRSLDGESRTTDEATKESFPSESTPGSKSKDQEEPASIEITILNESSLKNDDLTAKGFKRKSIARGLETLKIPSTFEWPAVASLRDWLPAGQVFSPSVHPTPEFGSYLLPTKTTMNVDKESIFDEELVTDLEEQLQQLKAEEETILKHITATWEEAASTGMKEDIAIL